MKSVIINFVSFCEKLKQSPSTRVLNEFLTQEKQFFQCCSHITQAHFIQCHVLSSLCEFCFSTVVLWSPVSKLTQRVHLYSRSSPMLLYISSIIGQQQAGTVFTQVGESLRIFHIAVQITLNTSQGYFYIFTYT